MTTTLPESAIKRRPVDIAVMVGLALAIAVVFGRVVNFDFVNFDDPLYIGEDLPTSEGASLQAVVWSIRSTAKPYWMPLTRLSHMLDFTMFGRTAGGHHAVNVILHIAAAIILYALLRRITARLWPSAIVAAMFALHPLRVESVAWVAERKDVLSSLLFLLTIATYVYYQRRPGSGRYLLIVAVFALGLMAKPMLVTVPFILLLLDYWPLRRISFADGSRVWMRRIAEKLPLLAMAIACAIGTYLAEATNAGLADLERFPLSRRLENIPVAYVRYLFKTIWPTDLAVFYPFPAEGWPIGIVAGSIVLLLAISAAAVLLMRRAPYVFVGWFWFVGTLVPVIGLVQAGEQSMADRFTLIPHIGLFIAIVFGIADLVRIRPMLRIPAAACGAIAIVGFAAVSFLQTGYWKNSESLFRRTLVVTTDNFIAHHQLGSALSKKPATLDESNYQYRAALRLHPRYPLAHYNLGNNLVQQRDIDGAIREFQDAIALKPDYSKAKINLAIALAMRKRFDEAHAMLEDVLNSDSKSAAEAHYGQGVVFTQQSRLDDAARAYDAALKLKPNFAAAKAARGKLRPSS